MIESNTLKQQIRVLFKIFFLPVSKIRFLQSDLLQGRFERGWYQKSFSHSFCSNVAKQVTRCFVVVAHFIVVLKQFQIKPRRRKSRAPQSDSNPRPLR